MTTAPRQAARKANHEPERHATEGVPRDLVGVLVRAPIVAAALALALVALCGAILVMPVNDEVPVTRQRAPSPAAVLAFALAIARRGLKIAVPALHPHPGTANSSR